MTLESLVKTLDEYPKEKRDDLKWLLLELLELDQKKYFLNQEMTITNEKIKEFEKLKTKFLNKNIPVQQLIGHTYFYGEKFFLNNKTLIPRKETEILVELTYQFLKTKYKDLSKLSILDLGTGTGIIGITLKKMTNANVTLVDISEEALEIARKNALFHQVDVLLVQSDWFSNINNKYDLIISNPPYIRENYQLEGHVLEEPHLALYSGKEGLDSYELILKDINNYLKNEFVIAFEHGYDQSKSLQKLTNKYLSEVLIKNVKDYNGNDRIMIITNK